ncbi:MAG: class I SAM-dependent methyltransferase [Candidatus Krumholzibacteriota bacterium]|nr:class I SAM-dependent methyltransferase [Candidatus Krumholzibacteriota bacterium]
MTIDPRRAYFDGIADRWDGWDDLDSPGFTLREGLRGFGVEAGERAVDLGCGTGNLTAAILALLGDAGRVVAVDFSPRMIALAAEKVRDGRASFLVADAAGLPLAGGSVDRIVCYSTWPHFTDHLAAARELARVLRPGGMLHVWHTSSRETINGIHVEAGGPVGADLLPPANELAAVVERAGFTVTEAIDAERYLVSARRTERS